MVLIFLPQIEAVRNDEWIVNVLALAGQALNRPNNFYMLWNACGLCVDCMNVECMYVEVQGCQMSVVKSLRSIGSFAGACGSHVDRMWIVVNSKCELIFARAFPPFRCCCCCCCYLHWHLVWLYVCVCWRAATCGRLPATLWTPLWNVGITGKLTTASHAIRLMSVCVCVSIEKSNSCLWFVKTFLN